MLAVAIVAAGVLAVPPAGAYLPAPDDPDRWQRPVVGARLAWLSADDLDLVGDAWADVPFWSRDRHHAFFALDVRTTIEDTSNSFDFVLRDIDYGAHVGWRFALDRGPVGALSAFAGQRGKARVDVDGDAWVRYVAVELQSRRFRQVGHPSWIEWSVAAGPVVEDRGISADAWLAGSLRFDGPLRTGRPKAGRFGFDVAVNGLLIDGALEADVSAGPHVVLPTGSGQAAVLFARYQWSDNPLGIGADTWLVGLEFVEDETARESGDRGPDIYAWLAAGLGVDERVGGTLRLRALTPVFTRHYRGVGTLEITGLGGGKDDERDELFYRYDLGLERVFDAGIAGVYFYHRSNHLLAEDGPGITSINVLEGGWESREWYRVGTRETAHRWGTIDYRARIGWLIESAFGEDAAWHARGGVRWTTPVGPLASQLYARVALEAGDVTTREIAVGLAAGRRLEFEVEYRDDEQFFGDSEIALVNLRYAF